MQLAIFNRIEPYVRDEHKSAGMTQRDAGDSRGEGVLPNTSRMSKAEEQRRQVLTRMPSRISLSSLNRKVSLQHTSWLQRES